MMALSNEEPSPPPIVTPSRRSTAAAARPISAAKDCVAHPIGQTQATSSWSLLPLLTLRHIHLTRRDKAPAGCRGKHGELLAMAVGLIDWLDLIIVSSLIKHVPIPFNRNQVHVIMTGVFV